ncbi:transcription factor-like 5 protein isoform X1 [Xyrichtys novacula]|uniref:Transcription factor-like 5 protein isoform X1 n=1 Tax=Xyrichtys novacula TaxID=13765 RepID=A0AAV1HI05_XYRNO|nr:transcription factor-like 5 protein isoform X1 [Xyrichtys novacula]
MSPSQREHTSVSVSHGGCLTHDQGQMLGPELGLEEISEVEYTHFERLIQSQMETQAAPSDGPDGRSPLTTTGSAVISPFIQAMDLSTATDEHNQVMPGEKTPTSFGEVPGFVLTRVRGGDISTEPLPNSSAPSQKRSKSAARVCLETRFNTVSADTQRQQDIQSALLSNFLTIVHQPSDAQDGVIYPQMQKCVIASADGANPYEMSGPFVIGHIPHRINPKHQGLIIPKTVSFNFLPDTVVNKGHYMNSSNSSEEQQAANKENDVATAAAYSKHGGIFSLRPKTGVKAVGSESITKKKTQTGGSVSQRRERHNIKERERRKRIRLYCDELNMLVPFCNSDTDKVTTLQWTTAYLRYINEICGDTFKEEFKRMFHNERGLFLKSSPSSAHDQIGRETDETLTIPLAVEQ